MPPFLGVDFGEDHILWVNTRFFPRASGELPKILVAADSEITMEFCIFTALSHVPAIISGVNTFRNSTSVSIDSSV